jgi:6-pyruvoyltetrahydropterin/6-carboxytetrahydropterin synthase
MFETGTSVTVRAFHVMTDLPPPEGERHAHEYRLDVVASRRDLDAEGMVVDLDVLDAALGKAASAVDGADLDDVIGPPGAVTVERFARWVHARLAGAMAGAGVDDLAVRVFESATAFGGGRGPVAAPGPEGEPSTSP